MRSWNHASKAVVQLQTSHLALPRLPALHNGLCPRIFLRVTVSFQAMLQTIQSKRRVQYPMYMAYICKFSSARGSG